MNYNHFNHKFISILNKWMTWLKANQLVSNGMVLIGNDDDGMFTVHSSHVINSTYINWMNVRFEFNLIKPKTHSFQMFHGFFSTYFILIKLNHVPFWWLGLHNRTHLNDAKWKRKIKLSTVFEWHPPKHSDITFTLILYKRAKSERKILTKIHG